MVVSFLFQKACLQQIGGGGGGDVLCIVTINILQSLLHLIPSLSISYLYLIKFHDFADNSQEGMKHQMSGATQAQQGMTLGITLLLCTKLCMYLENSFPKEALKDLVRFSCIVNGTTQAGGH